MADPSTSFRRALRAAGIVAAAVLLAIDPRGMPGVAVAGGAVVGVALAAQPGLAGFASHIGRAATRPSFVRAAVALCVVAMGWDLLAGRMPATRDHGIHYLRTHVLVHDLLPHGRLVGFSERLNLGFGFGDDYPVLPYLWAAGLHLASGGGVALRASYALGLFALLAAQAAALFGLTQQVARTVPLLHSRGASAAAAGTAVILFLCDPGGSREGGWEYALYHGVWPQALSVPGLLWAVSALLHLAPRPRRRSVAVGVLSGAVAILAHPFGWAALSVVCAAFSLAGLVSGTRPVRDGFVPVVVWVLATALALPWLGIFLEASGSLDRHPVWWKPLAELLSDLVRGRLLDHGGLGFLGPAGLVGLAALAVAGGRRGRTFVAAFLALLACASTDFVTVLRADLLIPQVRTIQFPRFAFYLTPMLCVAAGVGIVTVAAATVRRRGPPRNPRSVATRPVDAHDGRSFRYPTAALAGAAAAALWTAGPGLVRRPVGAVDTLEDHPLRAADAALQRELRKLRDELGRPPVVAFLRAGFSGATYPLLALADTEARVLLFGHVPTLNRAVDLGAPSPELLSALGVDRVVYDGPMPRGHVLAGVLAKPERVGSLRIARLRDPARPRRVIVTPASAQVHLSGDGLSGYRVEVTGLSENGGRFTAALSPHPGFVVELEGYPLEAEWRRLPGGGRGLSVAPPRDGVVTVTFRPSERTGWYVGVSLAALGFLVLLTLGNRPLGRTDLPACGPAGHSKRGPVLGPRLAVVAVLGCVLLAAHLRMERALARTWVRARTPPRGPDTAIHPEPPEDPPLDPFEADLVLAGAARVHVIPEDPCTTLAGRSPRRGCAGSIEAPRRDVLAYRGDLFRCLRVVVPPGGYAEIRLPAPAGHPALVLVGRRKRRGRRVEYRVVGVQPRARRLARGVDPVAVPGTANRGTLEVHVGNHGRRFVPVCIAAASFHTPAHPVSGATDPPAAEPPGPGAASTADPAGADPSSRGPAPDLSPDERPAATAPLPAPPELR